MSHAGRKIVVVSKAGGEKKAESQRAIKKEEITSTEFPEGGNTTSTKLEGGKKGRVIESNRKRRNY